MMQRNMRSVCILIMVIFLIAIVILTSLDILSNKEHGYKVMLDEQPWFYVKDKEGLEKLLSEYKNQYLTNIDNKAQIKSIEFKQRIEILEDSIALENTKTLEQAQELVSAKDKQALYYSIKEGDNFWNIAKKHNIPVEELIMLNKEINPEKICPGEQVMISPAKPKLDVVIKFENTIEETINFSTDYIKDNSMFSSQSELVSEGIVGKQEVKYEIILLNGIEMQKTVLERTVLEEPVNRKVKTGTKITVSRSGRDYGVVSGRLSSGFGYRTHPITGNRDFHQGIDIAANTGTPVKAYTDGKVTFAGWAGSYGNLIQIDHGNGLVTKYAHLSAIYVKVGERVKVMQRIGAVGTTGLSTGPHLHFEVLTKGTNKNPLNYL